MRFTGANTSNMQGNGRIWQAFSSLGKASYNGPPIKDQVGIRQGRGSLPNDCVWYADCIYPYQGDEMKVKVSK